MSNSTYRGVFCFLIIISVMVICSLYAAVSNTKLPNYFWDTNESSFRKTYAALGTKESDLRKKYSQEPNNTRETTKTTFHKRYVVMGVANPDMRLTYSQDIRWQYVYYIPLTVQAWWRRNVSSLIVISGENISENIWTEHHVFREIYRLVKDVPGIKFTYLEVASNYPVMIAQTARIFASTLFPGIPDDTFIISSDIDLVPLNGKLYDNLPIHGVRLLNAYCCGTFRHKLTTYRMYPMSNIAATVKVWKLITASHQVRSVSDMLQALEKYYKIPEKIVKGVNDGWYLDQHVVSILIEESSVKTELVSRSMANRIDRINNNAWNFKTIGKNMEDAHMPLPGWKTPDRVKNLLNALFENKELLAELHVYVDMFIN